jgi:hypothetical protein
VNWKNQKKFLKPSSGLDFIIRIRGFRVSIIKEFEVSGILEFRGLKVHSFQESRLQGFKVLNVSKFQSCKVSGIYGF